ncbi:MAG TPA: hypothetical protein VFS56_07925, partial [Gemmatimonadaceae bacterium]|nr:hypothetical protein [Gemmatimonadaceae bacterium]
ATLHDSHDRVRRSQVDSNYFISHSVTSLAEGAGPARAFPVLQRGFLGASFVPLWLRQVQGRAFMPILQGK